MFFWEFYEVTQNTFRAPASKYELRNGRLSAKREKDLPAKKRKYHDNPEKKALAVKRDVMIKPN